MDANVNEAEALASFLKVVNEVIRGNDSVNPMSNKTALKFLISRKFNVQRALELYQKHEIIRLQEGLQHLDPNEESLKSELNSGKFTILKQRDTNDCAIANFTAKLHVPNKSTKNPTLGKRAQQSTLQGIVYQLDASLEDVLTQRNGIVFIYNMSDSEYSNFDYDLCQKILNLLKGAYPAKLKKVLIVSPPLWFRAPFHLLRLIVREKLQKRVELVSIGELKNHLPVSSVPTELGGTYRHDHAVWLEECHTLHRVQNNDLCDIISAKNLVESYSQMSSGPNFRRPSLQNPLGFTYESNDDFCERISTAMIASSDSNNYQDNKNDVYDYDGTGLSLNLFLDLIREKGAKGLGDEYDEIVKSERSGTFLVSTNPLNMRKNRYINVVCYDHTRVVLEPYDLPEGISSNDPLDYINASYIDGYRQPRGYISTQGPIQSTFMDFWRMIWQTGCRVIVMVTANVENDIPKCDVYWPCEDDQQVLILGVYRVEYLGIERNSDFIITQLRLTNMKSNVSREISHLQFTSWPDFGVPETAAALLKYRDHVLKKQLEAIEHAHSSYPPIVVHCSAGIGRSGTFVTLDICIQKLETTGLVDVRTVVELLRNQRYSSIQTRDQYIFCYKAVVEYAASCGLLEGQDLNLFR